MLSIIIPTKNEEHYLPKLLESIKRQDYKDYEIIVADAGSNDKTRKIARKFGCKVVVGRKKGSPAIERNKGARVAKGDLLLFLDADTMLPKNFLEENVAEFKRRDLGIATCFQIPDSNNIIDKIYFKIANFFLLLGSFFYPGAYGFCIFTRKDVFNRIKGFKSMLFEDHDYARRASKISKYGIFKKRRIIVSVRRYIKFGRGKTILKNLVAGLYMTFFGKIKYDKFGYKLDYKK